MKQWSIHEGSLMFYDPYDIESPVMRITSAWPERGEQHFYVRMYSNGRSETIVEHGRCCNLAAAIQLAENRLTNEGNEHMTTKQYFQCRLRRGDAEQTAWLETRGAKVGATVELLPSHEPWLVVEVFDHGLPEDMLREQQKLNRHSLPSVDPIA